MRKKEKNKPKCEYCGNNPVPHFLNWYFESTNVLFTPFRQAMLKSPLGGGARALGQKINLANILVKILKATRVLSAQKDILKCKVARAKVLWEEADKRGVNFEELYLFGRPFDAYVAQKEGKTIVFAGLPRPENFNAPNLDLLDDKMLFKKRLSLENLPVPKGGVATNYAGALRIFNSITKPIIVKPRSGSRGRHSTIYVRTETDLKKAFKVAKKLCHWVIIEEMLFGPVYRATLIDYELCGVLRGDPPQVLGDGVHTIKELIEIKNRRPHPGVKDVVVDEAMERFLERELSEKYQVSSIKYQVQNVPPLGYIPKSGENIILSEKIGVNYGGSSSEDFEICHEDNKELFKKAAIVAGDPIVGFDFIIPDITRSYKEQRCGFIEANTLPFINLHHDPLLGKPRNVAAKVWDMVGF